jgi:hypothetical protein
LQKAAADSNAIKSATQIQPHRVLKIAEIIVNLDAQACDKEK